MQIVRQARPSGGGPTGGGGPRTGSSSDGGGGGGGDPEVAEPEGYRSSAASLIERNKKTLLDNKPQVDADNLVVILVPKNAVEHFRFVVDDLASFLSFDNNRIGVHHINYSFAVWVRVLDAQLLGEISSECDTKNTYLVDFRENEYSISAAKILAQLG